ncbi:LysR family transcriptional regulator [Variovorax sp. EL159]|uniref:LysR family transcriptional regulator n=1 Tax=Variovorax sp. EL159 TaxID=1566270 RepID=UPI000B8466C4|nr:LysR family transcriptional regulator [Variovorax sp. EL159]
MQNWNVGCVSVALLANSAIESSITFSGQPVVTLKQLEAFFWAIELGSLEEAASRLHTTQSAISKRVQELESALGIPLFDRSKRRVHATAYGQEILPLIAEMLNLRTRLIDIATAKEHPPRTLRLGVTDLTALTWLPQLIQRVRSSHPHVTLEPIVDTSTLLVERLRSAQLDLVVVPDAFREPQFDTVPLDSVEYAWMCSPSYLPEQTSMKLQELQNFTIISQLHGSGLGQIMKRWLSENQVSTEGGLSSSNLTAIASLTLSGMGISYLPRKIFDDVVQSGQLQIIKTTPAIPRIPYALMYRKGAADELLRFVTSVVTDTCDFARMLPGYFTTSVPRSSTR